MILCFKVRQYLLNNKILFGEYYFFKGRYFLNIMNIFEKNRKKKSLPCHSPKLLTLLSPAHNILYINTKRVTGVPTPWINSLHRKNAEVF